VEVDELMNEMNRDQVGAGEKGLSNLGYGPARYGIRTR
jgi:hypothetical protein